MKQKRKKVLEYPAVFTPSREGGYDVSFPDFPGCVTFGDTFDGALAHAHDVLLLWLEELAAQNQVAPYRDARTILTEVSVAVPTRLKVLHEAA